jgi:hypothetical protein
MIASTKTYQVYEIIPSFPNQRWRAVISDIDTGYIDQTKDFSTEMDARQWAVGILNKTLATDKFDMDYVTEELDMASSRIYGDFEAISPPPVIEKPEIEATCYVCGAKFKPTHTWQYWTDKLILNMQHCGKTEHKELSLQEAKEVAKVGYLAFL